MKKQKIITHQVDAVVMLPDNSILTDVRKKIIQSGYDHYWRFHDKAPEWAKIGCPFCINLSTRSELRPTDSGSYNTGSV